MKYMKEIKICLALSLQLAMLAGAAEEKLLESALKMKNQEAVLFTDVTGDGKPDILEAWWNGKRCRWFDENGDMTENDRRGDMVDDSLQVDMDCDGFYDGPEDIFKAMAKQSWDDAQLLYRAAWRAGLTDAELDELAIASSTWEKYDHDCWLKENLFRKLHALYQPDAKKQAALIQAYFTGDYAAMADVMLE